MRQTLPQPSEISNYDRSKAAATTYLYTWSLVLEYAVRAVLILAHFQVKDPTTDTSQKIYHKK